MYKCEYCGKKFNTAGNYKQHLLKYCKNSLEYDKEKFKKHNKNIRESILCLNNKKLGEFKLFKVKCHKCEKEFEVKEREKLFPKKEKYFCSRSCANSHIVTKEHREKVSKTILSKNNKFNVTKLKKCKICGNFYISTEGCIQTFLCGNHSTKLNSLYKLGFNKKVLGNKEEVEKELERIKNILIQEYFNKKLSASAINKKYGNVYKRDEAFSLILKFFNIKRRSHSSAVSLSYQEGRSYPRKAGKDYQYKQGWHTTWNGKRVYYRSSYELDYAKELDEKKVNYEMENLRIVYFDTQLKKKRTAFPDFYIPSENLIVEIKGDYTYNEQEMKDKFKVYKKLGYNCKLILEHKEINI